MSGEGVISAIPRSAPLEQQVLTFIAYQQARHSFAPSLSQLARELGISAALASALIGRLQQTGELAVAEGGADFVLAPPAPFTPEQEARIGKLIEEELGARAAFTPGLVRTYGEDAIARRTRPACPGKLGDDAETVPASVPTSPACVQDEAHRG